jgi:hypothetical protein
MSKPTKEQIQKYEFEHKLQFTNLVIANFLWLSMPGKNGFDVTKKDSKQYKAWYKMGETIGRLLYNWRKRQEKLESAPDNAVQKIPPAVYTWFFKKSQIKDLKDFAQTMIKAGTAGPGLGFIPLLIWGVIALVAFLSAAYIIDETTTTTQEKEELLKTTADTLKELNIPPDKAAAIISETQQQASENSGLLNSVTGGGFGKIIPFAVIAFFLMQMNNKQSKAAA